MPNFSPLVYNMPELYTEKQYSDEYLALELISFLISDPKRKKISSMSRTGVNISCKNRF